jgi:hypothetical protein
MDPMLMQETIARYMALPLHKALFINVTGDGYYVWNSGSVELQTVIDQTKEECQGPAAQHHKGDPQRCTPLYIDEQRMVDPSIYLQ